MRVGQKGSSTRQGEAAASLVPLLYGPSMRRMRATVRESRRAIKMNINEFEMIVQPQRWENTDRYLASGRLLGIVAVCLVLVGCQRTLPPEPPPPFQRQTIQVVCPAGLVDLIREESRPWQAQQQAKVQVQEYPSTEATAEGFRARGGDIWIFRPAELPVLAARELLRPVDQGITRRGNEYAWERVLPLYAEQLGAWDGVVYGLPLVGEARVFLYRADLVQSPVWQERYIAWQKKNPGGEIRVLQAPQSWEEVLHQAKFFRDQHPSGMTGPSLPPLPKDAEGMDQLFGEVAAPIARRGVRRDEKREANWADEVFSFHFDQKDGRPRIAGPGFVHALEVLAELQSCRPTGTVASPEEAFVSGQAVLGPANASVLAQLQRSPQRDRFGVCPIPGALSYFTVSGKKVDSVKGINRVPYLGSGGWLAAVPAGAKSPEAATDLLTDLTGPGRSLQVALTPRWGGGAPRADVLLRERWDSFDLDPNRTAALRETLSTTFLLHGLENPALVLRLPDQVVFRDALVAGLRRSLVEGVRPSDALADVQKRWEALIDNRGAAAHRRAYRVGLGIRVN